MASNFWNRLEALPKEVRGVLRSLRRSRGFTASLMGTLFLGMGTAALIFELTGWVTLMTLPYPDPSHLVSLSMRDNRNNSSYGLYGFQYDAYRQRTDLFSKFAGAMSRQINVLVGKDPVPAIRSQLTPDFLSMIGVKPARGRLFLPSEYRAGSNGVVIISDLFWRRHFHGDPSALGQTVVVDNNPCVVVGILHVNQQLFRLGSEILQPLDYHYDPTNPYDPYMRTIGILNKGVSTTQAVAALKASPPVSPTYVWPGLGLNPELIAAKDTLTNQGGYWLMFVAGFVLYAIACLNAATLMLVRFSGRRREWSIRLAIGGTRWDVIRLVVIEAGLLVSGTAAMVTLAAHWLFPFLVVYYGRNEDSAYNSFWDGRTLACIAALAFMGFVSIVALPVAGLVKGNIHKGLADGSAASGESPASRRTRSVLVVIQASFAVILIAGAGLMLQTYERLQHVDLGFNPSGLARIRIGYVRDVSSDAAAKRRQVLKDIRERLLQVPGVAEVAYGSDILLSGSFYASTNVRLADGSLMPIQDDNVSSEYLETAGLKLVEGRWVEDRPDNKVVINQTLAKAYFGTKDPVGLSVKMNWGKDDYLFEVVGVVRDVRESLRATPGPHLYQSIAGNPMGVQAFIVKLNRRSDAAFEALVRRTIYDLNEDFIVTVSPFDDVMGNLAFMERYASSVLDWLSVAALVLAAVGLFSALACTVDRRMPEFGIRMALGATPRDISRLVLFKGLLLAGAGVVIGAACALGLTRLMQSLLFETTPYDPIIYLASGVLLLSVAAAACWLPARRASRTDVTRLLRAE